MTDSPITIRERAVDLSARGALGLARLLPYALRVRLFGWVFSRIVAPLAGWRKRIDANARLAMPELSADERARLQRVVPDNVGRTLIEIYSGAEFLERVADAPRRGPGVAALEEARAQGRPMVLVTAHLGNYDAVRGTLSRQGFPMGALYKRMTNRAFNEHYVTAISAIATPVFPTDGKGVGGLVRYLKDGGIIGIVADVASTKAPVLSFFGQPAHTPLSAAEWALKYDAVMVPLFGIRQPDGLSFELLIEEPIRHTTPEDMMQTYNDVVERIVREDPAQWFWVHNRWKLSAAARAEAEARSAAG
ncbi:lauroyl acyltransferase [Alphaproteobacteria bacterium GH1-50]|uniref:Lauroyl acyltransferase n=1 Tax=Kangsaoukella pontilimi TaxID=2691042 RepID=A0A7C9MUN1_9RHOB|nr:lysophospholipid acyltransferase family protein [Kangsaoukella pontilimi]MXQ07020.1 lauroyl acyltransferase [Kangsaoukella pontilimi]